MVDYRKNQQLHHVDFPDKILQKSDYRQFGTDF